jgi:hypothetical protein
MPNLGCTLGPLALLTKMFCVMTAASEKQRKAANPPPTLNEITRCFASSAANTRFNPRLTSRNHNHR